ncbi:MAG: CDP-diacylglycerol--serine O-phosphatidyltransferase [Thermoanaerobaculales bacterium]|nr:CDP-diacylglycerol--serine O-phosphatidyltransferase [Thermoanaerobaculales bacterium]
MRRPFIRRRREGARLRRGIYIIPSLFTVANMFCGFFSVIESSRGHFEPGQGHFERAALLILIAIVADILDGRIARMTGATTAFGEAYDSLADAISFGIAPSVLAYQWGLWQVPRIGVAVAFLYLVAVAIRLARFNTTVHESSDFSGLPSPAGAGSTAMMVLLSPTPVRHPTFIPVVVVVILCLALLMVSSLPYRSGKTVDLRRQWPAPTLFLIAVVFSLVTLDPRLLAVLAGLYVLSAPVKVLVRRLRGTGGRSAGAPGED